MTSTLLYVSASPPPLTNLWFHLKQSISNRFHGAKGFTRRRHAFQNTCYGREKQLHLSVTFSFSLSVPFFTCNPMIFYWLAYKLYSDFLQFQSNRHYSFYYTRYFVTLVYNHLADRNNDELKSYHKDKFFFGNWSVIVEGCIWLKRLTIRSFPIFPWFKFVIALTTLCFFSCFL